jgi:hypothetical protein
MGRNDLLQRIGSAKNEISAAENEIRLVLHEMQVSASGEEVTVSRVVQDAFVRLREAKDSLARLEKLLTAAP